MDSKLYTIEPSQRCTSELERLVAGGPSAVRGAVGTEFTLVVGPSELRVRVRPALENETLSIQLDALDVPFELLVTVVYDARLRASSRASRLYVGNDLYEGVQRLMDSRIGDNEVCVFVSTTIAKTQRVSPLVQATKTILTIVRECGLASARTMLVVRSDEQLGSFGSTMFEGSNVYVGKVGGFPMPSVSPDEQARADVQTLFEGGVWAIRNNDASSFERPISIAGNPPLRVRIRTNRDPYRDDAFVLASVDRENLDPDATLELIAVHGAGRVRLQTTLLRTTWLREYADPVSELTRQHVKPGSRELVIFATPCSFTIADAGAWMSVLRRVVRTLRDLKLTAQQENTDALVVVRFETADGVRLEAMRLLYLIDDFGAARSSVLRLREIGASKTRAKKVKKS